MTVEIVRLPLPVLVRRDPVAMQDHLVALARGLCTLRWRAAFAAFAVRVAEHGGDAVDLLSSIFAGPPEVESAGVTEAALHLATSLLEQREGGQRGKKHDTGEILPFCCLIR